MTKKILPFVLALILILTLAFVVYMTRRDSGFITTECGELKWKPERFPLPVYVDEQATDWLPAIQAGISFWGQSVDWLVFTDPLPKGEVSDQRDGVVFIELFDSDGSEIEGRPESGIVWDKNCTIRRAVLKLPARLPKDRREQAVRHELGHSLGLADDSREGSLMYAGGKGSRWSGTTPSDQDLALITHTYFPFLEKK